MDDHNNSHEGKNCSNSLAGTGAGKQPHAGDSSGLNEALGDWQRCPESCGSWGHLGLIKPILQIFFDTDPAMQTVLEDETADQQDLGRSILVAVEKDEASSRAVQWVLKNIHRC